jgi:PAS domain S-box-containing protein
MRKIKPDWLHRLLDVPAADPDDARRRKLLNILVVISTSLALLAFIATAGSRALDLQWRGSEAAVVDWHLLIIAGVFSIFGVINRHISGWLASTLYLIFFTSATPFSDTLQEVAEGRSLIGFVVPIVMASVLLRPYASFIFAGLSYLVVSAISLYLHWTPNPYTAIILFLVAFVSWLAARNLENTLREARSESSKNQVILESIADGVIVFDPAGRVTVVNNTVAHFLDQPAGEVVGRDIETLLTDVDAQAREAILDFLASPERRPIQFQWRDRTLSASAAPVRLDSGEEIGSVAVLRDVTREVEAQRAKESMFAVAAHELRTPLNAIINFANMIHDGVLGPEQQLAAAGRIAVNGERLLILANNLLERARMEAGEARLSIEQFAPAKLISDVEDVMGVLAQEKGLELTTHVAADVPATIAGDRRRLHQVLVNLVSNAVKFTDEGEVRMRVYMPDSHHWTLEVSDTGGGIPAEARSRIFEPFELAEDPSTRKHAGAGLGLSIVKRMVELMGGEIALKSEVGQGSTFTVTLPLVLSDVEGLVPSADIPSAAEGLTPEADARRG